MGVNFANGGEQTARSNVMQVKYTTYDHINFSGTGYHTVKDLSITPYYSDSRIIVTINCVTSCVQGHAGQGRILKSVGGGSYGLINYSTDGSRAQGHGGEEGTSSDGGMAFMIHIWDHPNTTSSVTYRYQIGFESSGGSQRVGTSSRNYSNQGGYGYPGTFRQGFTLMEVANA